MADKKYNVFLEKLIKQTKENKIEWKYLDSNKSLCESMCWIEEIFPSVEIFSGNKEYSFNFNAENSFYCEVKGTYIALYVAKNNPAELLVIPPTFKSIVQLTPDEYGENITRLLNLVKSQFPSGDAFIDDFINN